MQRQVSQKQKDHLLKATAKFKANSAIRRMVKARTKLTLDTTQVAYCLSYLDARSQFYLGQGKIPGKYQGYLLRQLQEIV